MKSAIAEPRLPLLMLSHVFPTPEGAGSRAWQLLGNAAHTHEVYLACLVQGAVQLRQWRRVQGHASRCVMEPGSSTWGLQPPWRSLQPSVQTWAAEQRFDIVLATDPGLWPLAQMIHARLHVCDLHAPVSEVHQRLAEQGPWLSRWWHRRQFVRHDQAERAVVRSCDLLTVSQPQQVRRYAAEAARTLLMPPSDQTVPLQPQPATLPALALAA